jgi:hypothetical protein
MDWAGLEPRGCSAKEERATGCYLRGAYTALRPMFSPFCEWSLRFSERHYVEEEGIEDRKGVRNTMQVAEERRCRVPLCQVVIERINLLYLHTSDFVAYSFSPHTGPSPSRA